MLLAQFCSLTAVMYASEYPTLGMITPVFVDLLKSAKSLFNLPQYFMYTDASEVAATVVTKLVAYK